MLVWSMYFLMKLDVTARTWIMSSLINHSSLYLSDRFFFKKNKCENRVFGSKLAGPADFNPTRKKKGGEAKIGDLVLLLSDRYSRRKLRWTAMAWRDGESMMWRVRMEVRFDKFFFSKWWGIFSWFSYKFFFSHRPRTSTAEPPYIIFSNSGERPWLCHHR